MKHFFINLWKLLNIMANDIDMSICDKCGYDNFNKSKPKYCKNCNNKLTN